MRSRHLISATTAQSQGYVCFSCRLKSAKSIQQATENYSSLLVVQNGARPISNAGSPQRVSQSSVSTDDLHSFQHSTILSRRTGSVRENPSLATSVSNQKHLRFCSTKQASSHSLAEKKHSGNNFRGPEQYATLEKRVGHPSQGAWGGGRVWEKEIHAVQLMERKHGDSYTHYGKISLRQPTFVRRMGNRKGIALSPTSSRSMQTPFSNTFLTAYAGAVVSQYFSSYSTQSQNDGNDTAHSLRSAEEAASRALNPDHGVGKQKGEEEKTMEPHSATSPNLASSEDTRAPNDQSPGRPKSKASKSKPKPKPKPKSKSKSKVKAKQPKATETNDQALLAEHIETQIEELRKRLHEALSDRSSKKSAASVVRRTLSKSKDPSPKSHASIGRRTSQIRNPLSKARERVARFTKLPGTSLKEALSRKAAPIHSIGAVDLNFQALDIDRPPVPRLAYGLERVLFNPGVYQLQDPRSGVYNFEPYLQKLMPIEEFNFNALGRYITSSKDAVLQKIAKEHGKRYIGSTSSMTSMLAHFHFLLSQWRPINFSMLSKSFPNRNASSFTEIQRCPSAIFLKWQDGTYAIDADKQFDGANVLSMLGRSMEKLLTLKTDDFERYRKSNPTTVTEEESNTPESYHYSTMGDFLMRSQLDAYDPRIPGTGMFDLKTRAVVSVRMDVQQYEYGTGYQIKHRTGEWESYEREYFDMIRAAFLKYSLQVRMGRMDGIFVAFHNVERLFGFQYISLPEMDATLHGQFDTTIGDQEFALSLDLLNKILDKAIEKFPEKSLRLHFETREAATPFMYIFAEPVSEQEIHDIQTQNASQIEEFERRVLGLTKPGDAGQTKFEDTSKWEDIQANVEDAMNRDELSLREGAEENYQLTEAQDHGASSHDRAFDEENFDRASASDDEEMEDDEDDEGEKGEETEELEEAETEEKEKEEQEEGEVETGNEEGELQEDEERGGEDAQSDEEGTHEGEGSSRRKDGKGFEVERAADAEAEKTNSRGKGSKVQSDPPGDQSSSEMEASAVKEPRVIADMNRESASSSADQQGEDDDFNIEADATFLEKLSTDEALQPNPEGELLAMTLTIRNKINNYYVFRPEQVRPEDRWCVEYSLAEVPSAMRAHALYAACKARRQKRLEQEVKSSIDDAGEAGPLSNYVQSLRKLSTEGRAWREKMDEMAKEQPVHVLGRDK